MSVVKVAKVAKVPGHKNKRYVLVQSQIMHKLHQFLDKSQVESHIKKLEFFQLILSFPNWLIINSLQVDQPHGLVPGG